MFKGFDYEDCSEQDLADVVQGMSRQLFYYTKEKYKDNAVMLRRLQRAKIQARINELQKELEEV